MCLRFEIVVLQYFSCAHILLRALELQGLNMVGIGCMAM